MAIKDTSTGTAKALRTAVNNMDALAQEGLDEISAVARLALRSLETPEAYSNLNDIASALRTICSKADATQDGINAMAERVGCSYTDDADLRRSQAWATAVDRCRQAEMHEAAAARAGKEAPMSV